MATYVLDDLTDQFSTGNTVGESKWVEIQGSRFFGGSAIYPPFAGNSDDTGDSGNYGTLKMTAMVPSRIQGIGPERLGSIPGGTLQRENTLLWSSGTISAGDHTLKIEVTSSTNGAALVLDYLLYTPSFDTLAKNGGSAQPAQPAQAVTSGGTSSPSAGITSGQATSTSGSGSGTESSTVSSGVSLSSYTTVISGSTVYGTVTLSGAGGGTTSAASAISEPGTSSAKGVPIGAVVGGVVGGVALLGIALLLVFCRKRLVRRKSSDLTPAGTPAAILPPIEPFTGSPRSSSARLTAPIEKGRQAPYPIVVPAARSNTHTLSENSYPSSSGESNVPSTPSQWQSPSVNTYPPSSAQGSVHEMNDLQSLISEFNRATQVHGEANLRVVELQNRIAEIAQQATVDRGSAHLGKHEMLSTMAVPPPYEMN
ncbi:hypothetical protein H0H87_007552 [Tephrocybe sp. NHM501043]|nr:hypothetical protein H0H87_007552 [Tephrocybe sp. NHM501043]